MSPQGVTIEVPIPYEIQFARASGTGSTRVRVCETVPVHVACVDAPVAVTATFHTGDKVEWRERDGALWRPMFRNRSVHSERVGLEDLRARLRDRSDVTWSDDPFSSLSDFGKGALKSREEVLRGGRRRILLDGRETAIEAARAIAADLLLVDGVPYRKAPEPVWTVGTLQVYSLVNAMVRLVPPDLEGEVMSPFAFPYDAFDEAQAFALSARDVFGARAALPVVEEWSVASSREGKGFGKGVSDARAWLSFRESISTIPFGKVPTTLLPAIAKAQEAFDAGDVDGLSDALDGLGEIVAPLVAAGYTGCGALLQVRRIYAESRRQLDEDDAYALSTVI